MSINNLNENKTVTFNGQINPNYGWAVIMAGGAGVGKSTVVRNQLPITGKLVSSDYFKELYADVVNAEQSPNWKGKKIFSQNDIYLNGEDDTHTSKYFPKDNIEKKPFKRRSGEKIWDLTKRTDASEINRVEGDAYSYSHNFLGKMRDNLLKGNVNGKYLPNLIFDMAGAKGDTLEKTFEFLKKFEDNGQRYHVCLVWVVANRAVAFASMQNRDRVVPDEAFHKGHNKVNGDDGVIKTLKKYRNQIDEAWIVFTSTYDETENGRIDRRLSSEEKNSNVVKLEKINGKFVVPSFFSAMGKNNFTLSDIQGQKVATGPGAGVSNPKPGEPLGGKIFPTSNFVKKHAKANGGRYIDNVDVYDTKEREISNAQRMNNYKQGKTGTRHISLTENELRKIIRESLKELFD